jgi:hypothetical protein
MKGNGIVLRMLGVALSAGTVACAGSGSGVLPTAATPAASTVEVTVRSGSGSQAGLGSGTGVVSDHPIRFAYAKDLLSQTVKSGLILRDGTKVLIGDGAEVTLDGKPGEWWTFTPGTGIYAEGSWVVQPTPEQRGVLQASLVQGSSAHADPGPVDPTTPQHPADPRPVPDPADPGSIPGGSADPGDAGSVPGSTTDPGDAGSVPGADPGSIPSF